MAGFRVVNRTRCARQRLALDVRSSPLKISRGSSANTSNVLRSSNQDHVEQAVVNLRFRRESQSRAISRRIEHAREQRFCFDWAEISFRKFDANLDGHV